jgi:diaminobutyrate-2-oxoglutarate transaminase
MINTTCDTTVFEQWESQIRGACRAFPTVFKTAKNAHQIAENGKSYIDFFSGAGGLNIGQNNVSINKAQLAYIEYHGVTHRKVKLT